MSFLRSLARQGFLLDVFTVRAWLEQRKAATAEKEAN